MLLLSKETESYSLVPVAQLIPDCMKVLPEHKSHSPLARKQGEDWGEQEAQPASGTHILW